MAELDFSQFIRKQADDEPKSAPPGQVVPEPDAAPNAEDSGPGWWETLSKDLGSVNWSSGDSMKKFLRKYPYILPAAGSLAGYGLSPRGMPVTDRLGMAVLGGLGGYLGQTLGVGAEPKPEEQPEGFMETLGAGARKTLQTAGNVAGTAAVPVGLTAAGVGTGLYGKAVLRKMYTQGADDLAEVMGKRLADVPDLWFRPEIQKLLKTAPEKTRLSVLNSAAQATRAGNAATKTRLYTQALKTLFQLPASKKTGALRKLFTVLGRQGLLKTLAKAF